MANEDRRMNKKIEEIVELMKQLSDDERLEVMSHFCTDCGCIQPETGPRCCCWNDE